MSIFLCIWHRGTTGCISRPLLKWSILLLPLDMLLRGKYRHYFTYQFSSFQSLSCVQLFATPWITACQASLSITNSRSLLKLMSIESVMPSSHLILSHPLLLLPPMPPSIRVLYWSIKCPCQRLQFPPIIFFILYQTYWGFPTLLFSSLSFKAKSWA